MTQQVLTEAFRYPFKQEDWKTKLLVAYGLQLFAWLLIPAVPLYGYLYRLAKDILETGQDRLPAWDDWEGDFRRGLRWWVFLLLLASPLLVVALAGVGIALMAVFAAVAMPSDMQDVFSFPLMFLPFMNAVLAPLALLYGVALLVFAPPALLHITRHDRLSAALEVKDWWAIFQANWEGFVMASLVVLGLIVVLNYLSQTLFWLTCLFGVFLNAAIHLYVTLVAVYLFAHAYRQGLEKVASAQEEPAPSASAGR